MVAGREEAGASEPQDRPPAPAGAAAPPRRLGGALRHASGELARRRDGGVAVTFALALIPLTFAVGAAVDYSRAGDAQTHLDIAADAAALATVTPSAMARSPNDAEASAMDAFQKRAALVRHAGDVKPKIKVKDHQGTRTTTVSYRGKVATTFMGLAGFKSVEVAGDATASSNRPLYMDFYVLLDNSPSMGLAATTSDIAKMEAATRPTEQPNGCAFACHDLSGGRNTLPIARSAGVTLRIDVVRSATQKLMDTAAATAVLPGQFRAALYTFGSSCSSPGLTTLSSLSSNLSSVKASASAIDLMTIPSVTPSFVQCTDYEGIFSDMRNTVSSSGDGTSANDPQKVVFFVSDGVADANRPQTCSQPVETSGWQTVPRCQEPMREALCKALKDRGVKVAVLYTTYLPLPQNDHYRAWIAPFSGAIGPKMQACASPGLFFEVSPSQGIAEAMEALFKKAVSQARLTS